MAMFPAAPPAGFPEMRPGPTSGFFVRQERAFFAQAGREIVRVRVEVDFAGDDAKAHVAGAAVGDGDFHHDDTVFVTHDAVACESRQVMKKVLRGGATGVFQGKILVKKGAQKTDGYQLSQGLLLDERSQFLAKPELEIYADDVKCAHGASVGELDPDQLFYALSRGLDPASAKALLLEGFVMQLWDDAPVDRREELVAETRRLLREVAR